jgi:hypothetical protein
MATDELEGDLMDAMNAALLEDNNSENDENLGSVSGHSMSGHSSLRSVDVMDENAMDFLLSGDGDLANFVGGDEGDTETTENDEEEIDFDAFLKPADEINNDTTKQEEKGTASKSKTKNNSNSNEESSDNSPTSVLEAAIGNTAAPKDKGKASQKAKPTRRGGGTDDDDDDDIMRQQPQVVPMKQFENALALIQDLENRIQVLETDQQCLLEENEQLRETTNKQATVLADMESKLERFPKLLEQTVQEEAVLAAKKAETEIKVSFWKRDLARQEQQREEEKKKKNRVGQHGATTDSLKQADFLKEVVERKEKEDQDTSAAAGTGVAAAPRGPGGIFQALRGWGNRNNNNNNNSNNNNNDNNNNNNNDRDNSKKDVPAIPTEGNSGGSMELQGSKSNDSLGSSSRPSMDFDDDGGGDDDETNNGIDHHRSDSKVLNLMT